MKKNIKKNNRGFTLAEAVVGLAVVVLIAVALSIFQRDIFSFNITIQSGLSAQLDAKHLVRTMISELRRATVSSTGSYPIESVATSSIVFYSDINDDGKVERVRYYLNGTTIKKGIVSPTGNPSTYNLASEVVSNLIANVVSSTTLPVFQYYTSSYDGTTSSMSYPIDIPSVRLVRVNVIIDNNPNRSPTPLVVSSSVSLRNLKDNL